MNRDIIIVQGIPVAWHSYVALFKAETAVVMGDQYPQSNVKLTFVDQ